MRDCALRALAWCDEPTMRVILESQGNSQVTTTRSHPVGEGSCFAEPGGRGLATPTTAEQDQNSGQQRREPHPWVETYRRKWFTRLSAA